MVVSCKFLLIAGWDEIIGAFTRESARILSGGAISRVLVLHEIRRCFVARFRDRHHPEARARTFSAGEYHASSILNGAGDFVKNDVTTCIAEFDHRH